MASVIAEFLSVTGLELPPPADMAGLIPYLLTVLIGVVLVSGVFRVIGKLFEAILNFKRW